MSKKTAHTYLGAPVTPAQHAALEALAAGEMHMTKYPTRAEATVQRVLNDLVKRGFVTVASTQYDEKQTYTLVDGREYMRRRQEKADRAAAEAARTPDDRMRERLLLSIRVTRTELRNHIAIASDMLQRAVYDLERDDSVNSLGILQGAGMRVDALAGEFMAYKRTLELLDEHFPVPPAAEEPERGA